MYRITKKKDKSYGEIIYVLSYCHSCRKKRPRVKYFLGRIKKKKHNQLIARQKY